MKTLSNGILFVFLALLFIASCGKLDNYDGPNASIIRSGKGCRRRRLN